MLSPEHAERDLRRTIAGLPKLSRQELLALWQKLYGREAPNGLRRELLIPFLAFRVQERAFGGLKSSTRSELRRIAEALEKGQDPIKTASPITAKPGTRFVRVWGGKRHEVVKTESGFEYCGTGYRSLSEIARKITGTRWSGPAFFGLRDKRALQNGSND